MKKIGVAWWCSCKVTYDNEVSLCIKHSMESERLHLTPHEMVDKFVSDYLDSCKIAEYTN